MVRSSAAFRQLHLTRRVSRVGTALVVKNQNLAPENSPTTLLFPHGSSLRCECEGRADRHISRDLNLRCGGSELNGWLLVFIIHMIFYRCLSRRVLQVPHGPRRQIHRGTANLRPAVHGSVHICSGHCSACHVHSAISIHMFNLDAFAALYHGHHASRQRIYHPDGRAIFPSLLLRCRTP